MLFKGFPNACNVLASLRNGTLERRSSAAWATEWEEHAKPLVLEACIFFLWFTHILAPLWFSFFLSSAVTYGEI